MARRNAPERIERLVDLLHRDALPPPEMWTERAAQVRAEGMGAVIDATMERWFTPEFPKQSPEVVGRIRDTFLSTPPEGYAGCCEALAEFDIRGGLGAVEAPALVIAGEDDPVGTPERAEAIGEEIPDCRVVVLENARHLAAVERADAVTRELERHLGAGVGAR